MFCTSRCDVLAMFLIHNLYNVYVVQLVQVVHLVHLVHLVQVRGGAEVHRPALGGSAGSAKLTFQILVAVS